MGFVSAYQVTGIAVQGKVIQDRTEIVFIEAARSRGQAEGLVHLAGAHDRGELDSAGHLGPNPGRSGGGGLDEPLPGAVADGQKVVLGLGARAWAGWPGMVAAWVVGVVLVED